MFNLGHNVQVICASKYFNTTEIKKLYNLGYRLFGENRVQDFLAKYEDLKSLDIEWHYIGQLQTNKVKQMINKIDYLHTLDRISLCETIQKYAIKPIKSFIQVNLTEEPQKNGVLLENLEDFINEIKKYDKINLIGLMTIGMHDDKALTEKVFKKLNELKTQYSLEYTSMGMSDDYEIAIKCHATHIRIGSKFKEVLKECKNGHI